MDNKMDNKIELNIIYQEDYRITLNKIPDKSIDLLCTDPPYKQNIGGGGSIKKKFDYRLNDLKELSDFEPNEFLKLIKPKLKKFNAYIWTSKDLIYDYIKFAKDNNYNFDILIYAKNNPIPAKNNTYLSDVEYCIFIREGGVTFNNNLEFKKYKKVMFDNANNTGLGHPTIKHLWMIKKMIEISSNENDIIYDPFIGSGTTAIACKILNRNYIGSEIKKRYYELSKKRLNEVKFNLHKFF